MAENITRAALFEISSALSSTDDHELISSFLESLLTPRELEEITARWELVKRIQSGESQRKISQELGLSLCKITRGSKELKKENSAFLRMLKIASEQ
jgi:TrpR family trp operon transcriptional repressor